MSLTWRVIVSFALIALAGFAVLLSPVLDRVERQYLEATEEPMVDVAEILAALLSSEASEPLIVPEAWVDGMRAVEKRALEARIYNLVKETVLMDFYLTDTRGRVLYDSGGLAEVGEDYSGLQDVYRTLQGGYGARSTKLDAADITSTIMYVAAPVMKNDRIVGVVSVYKPQRSMLLFVMETKRWLIFLSAIGLVVVMLLGWLLSRWVTRPLGELTEYAAAVSQGERPPVPQLPGSHLRVLGETTEAMREALENRKYVESYVQSLTHEMKSPLAGIRAAAELLHENLPKDRRKQFLGNIEEESSRLQNLIDRLLALASLENRSQLGAPVEISLSGLARQIVSEHNSHALERRVGIQISGAENDIVCGETFLLETAISNLVQNAIGFSPVGGSVRIKVVCRRNEVVLSVTDEGCGIPEYALNRIFDRFYSLPRPNAERKSSGLGLCFAKEAAVLHGGSLVVANRENERGAQAVLRLPRGIASQT